MYNNYRGLALLINMAAKNIGRRNRMEKYAREFAETPKKVAYVPRYSGVWNLPTLEDCLSIHNSWAAIETQENDLANLFDRFGVDCAIDKPVQGPVFVRYMVKPLGSTKFSKIMSLENEIKGALNNNNLSVFQDGSSVVIEVPTAANTVRLGDILNCDAFKNGKKTTVGIGLQFDGTPMLADVDKMPHMLVAGTTGSGKSVFIQGIILSLLMKNTPEDIELYMIDPKMVEFSYYQDLVHCHVVNDVQPAIDLLSGLCNEMDQRYSLLASAEVRDIDSYNAIDGKHMKRKVVIVDELADLMMTSKDSVEGYIVRLAQKARACGIHLILATQRPTVNVVTGLIKANIPTKVCFAVSSVKDSVVMLDKGGAEKLVGKGDMLYRSGTGINAVRLQGGFVTENGIKNIVYRLMNNQEV